MGGMARGGQRVLPSKFPFEAQAQVGWLVLKPLQKFFSSILPSAAILPFIFLSPKAFPSNDPAHFSDEL